MRKRLIILMFAAASYLACSDGGGGPNVTPTNVLAKAAGDNQNGTVNTVLDNAFCARVTAGGANKSGVTVNWTTPSGGSLSAASSVTGTDGVGCSTLTLGTSSGAQSAQAAVTGATGSPVTFNATADPGPAATIASTGGDNQTADINTTLDTPLGVKVADQFGNGVPGILVTWAVTSGTATLNPFNGNTNAAGNATTVVTLGGTAGPIVITATSTGLNGSPMTFDATATVPTPVPAAITIQVGPGVVFSPAVDTVAVGGTVTWNWPVNSLGHSVTSTGATSFVDDPAGISDGPKSYGPITFNNAGTYFYYCEAHGTAGSPPTGMSGRIVVK